MGPSPAVAVINGPNLGELGTREPEIYGGVTQEELVEMVRARAQQHGLDLEFFQSDIEGELVRAVNSASGRTVGLVINPAAYSHYSIAIMDAMQAYQGPVVEVHISRVLAREPFRSNLVTAAAADAFISGAGTEGYLHALDILQELRKRKDGGMVSAHQQ
ncbi:MAG: 3-dehydroquinate dehydratase [Candidatus Fermentibacteraceae bacterium]|nr:3-dehydroquinate dehydratase [Candidatus Fermentibacteraceae bacterium]MBN2608711.1 3-dehydroquinate dehydratase [Candidatus Fermentibacteraceae bacterium]